VPATRSRTENWRQSIAQIIERRGSIELAVRPPAADAQQADLQHPSTDLVWRVRVLEMTDSKILVAPPAAAGQQISLADHLPLVASFVVGQNRWAFRTSVLGKHAAPSRSGEEWCIAISTPVSVDRCPRRSSPRIGTTNFALPEVSCWPSIDPGSIALAEEANRAALTRAWTNHQNPPQAFSPEATTVMPVVGPRVAAHLQNISGGGVGLLLTPDAATALDRHPFIWVQLNLPPHVPAPLCVTVRKAHSHLESNQMVYFGCALDFTWNPQGQRFVADLFARYMACIQGQQKKPAANTPNADTTAATLPGSHAEAA